jgi:HK97 gp10 family phage protein
MQALQAAFQTLGDKAAKRVVKSAATAGASQLRTAIRQAAPVSKVDRKTVYGGHKYGYLKKHLRQQIGTKIVKALEADVKILVHTSDAFWGRFIEKGTKRGIDARHWMESAFDAAEGNVKSGMESKIVQAIMREAGKGGR